MKVSYTMLVSFLIVLFVASFATSQEQSWNVNFKGGLLFPGTVSVEGYDVDTEMGWMIHGYFDGVVAPKLSLGGFILFAGTSAADFDESANIITLGGTIKGRFKAGTSIYLRPGLALGYQMIGGDAFEDVKGLNISAIFELVKSLQNKNAIVGELGFITQPAGGNEDADVTFGPIFYLTVGYEFGG
jgi:hypothetical protein